MNISDVNTPLSGENLEKFFSKYDIVSKIIPYNDLKHFEDLESIFDTEPPLDVLVLLYEFKKGVGHWTGVLRRPRGYEFFDPYGLMPDDERKFLPKDMWIGNFLSKLLLRSNQEHGKIIEYNEHKLQNMKDQDISTCGKWVAIRAMFRKESLEKFANRFKNLSPKEKDQTISLFFFEKYLS